MLTKLIDFPIFGNLPIFLCANAFVGNKFENGAAALRLFFGNTTTLCFSILYLHIPKRFFIYPNIHHYHLTAEDFGLTPYHQEQLAGGTPEENRDILTRLLQGKGDAAHEAAVAANVAMLMRLHGHEDLQANAQTVLEVLRSGSAYDRVTALAARG